MRCTCCNTSFKPKIIYKRSEGKLVFDRFEELCKNCIAVAYDEFTAEDILTIRQTPDNIQILMQDFYTYLD